MATASNAFNGYFAYSMLSFTGTSTNNFGALTGFSGIYFCSTGAAPSITGFLNSVQLDTNLWAISGESAAGSTATIAGTGAASYSLYGTGFSLSAPTIAGSASPF